MVKNIKKTDMKKKYLFTLFVAFVVSFQLTAQVKIGDHPTSVDSSALLELESSTKGFLISRMDSLQRSSITNPAEGLLVYQTNATKGFYYYTGSAWTLIAAGTETDPVFAAHAASVIMDTNISNWNTAYTWGTHAGLYRPITWVPSWTDITAKPALWDSTWASIKNKPTTAFGYGITDVMTTAHVANAIMDTNISNWNTAYTWGTHAGLYRPITWVPSWTDITAKPALWDSTWASIKNKPTTIVGYGITDAVTTTGVQSIAGKKTFSDTLITNGINANNKNIINVAQQGIGTATPDSSAALDISSTTKGFLPPRMTIAQRNAIVSPAKGLVIYNTTCGLLNVWNDSIWVSIGTIAPFTGLSATITPNPLVVGHTLAFTGTGANVISWSWSGPGFDPPDEEQNIEISGAQNSIAGAYILTATNQCGATATDTVVLLPGIGTFIACGSNYTTPHTAGAVAPVTKNVTYGTIISDISGASLCWITQNLGANNQATSAIDATDAAAGWYWQFNRKQGYKNDGTSSLTPSWTISSISENSNWTSGNDPCTLLLGSGWRLPTNTEWINVDENGSWNNNNDAYNSTLKLHAAGFLNSSDGKITSKGSIGFYWGSTQNNGTDAKAIYLTSNSSYEINNNKAYGFSVRCVY